MSCFWAAVNLPPIGILSVSIIFHSKLRSGFPGAITGPLAPPAMTPLNVLRSRAAIFFWSPWQLTQFFSRTGRISLLKSGARWAAAGTLTAVILIPSRNHRELSHLARTVDIVQASLQSRLGIRLCEITSHHDTAGKGV